MLVQDLMSHPAVTCHVNDTAGTAAHLMWEHDCGMIAVVRDDGQLAGVVTDRDLCMAAFTQGRPPDEILVNTAMAQHVVTATPDLKIVEAEQRMAERRIRRLPVIDADGKPIGVIAINDLAIESVQPDTRMITGHRRSATRSRRSAPITRPTTSQCSAEEAASLRMPERRDMPA